jgi:hypothetical protein
MRYDNMQPRGKVQSYRRIVLPTQQAQAKAVFKESELFPSNTTSINTQICVHVST